MTTWEDLMLWGIRRERLLRQIRELEQLVSGRTISFRELYAGEDGLPDLQRLEAAAEELARNYELFRKHVRADAFSEEDVIRDLEREESRMTEQDRRMVRSFFYCMLRLLADSPWLDGTVGELLLCASWMERRTQLEVIADEMFLHEKGGVRAAARRRKDFFVVCDAAYEALTLENIMDTVPEAVREMFAGRPAEDAVVKKQVTLADREKAIEARRDMEIHAWSGRFGHADRFCEAYRNFRESWFAQGTWPEAFAETVQLAVDYWLSENRLNHFSDDPVYFSTQNLLREAIDRAATLIAEAQRPPERRTRKLPGGGVL